MIKAINAASPEYYLTPDCPIEGRDLEARWDGKGAKRLGLTGEFATHCFLRLARGLHPETGDKLTARLKADRKDATDVCVTVPKPVSILIEVGQDERLKEALWEANRSFMRDWEKGVKVRVRKGGVYKDRETDNIVVASFYHGTTRPIEEKRDPSHASFYSNGVEILLTAANQNAPEPRAMPDPHSHIHNYVCNLSHDPVEGIHKAMKRIYYDIPRMEHKFNKRLAKSMKKLGYDAKVETRSVSYATLDEVPEEYRDRVDKTKAGTLRYVTSTIKVKGIGEEMEALFSRRQGEVKAEEDSRPHLHAEGNKTYRRKMEAAKAQLSQATRSSKSLAFGLTREAVHRFWVSRMTGEDFAGLSELVAKARSRERMAGLRSHLRNYMDRVRDSVTKEPGRERAMER